jgi:hypothetical protein
MSKALLWLTACALLAIVIAVLAYRPAPEKIEYGATFSKFFADELGVDWIDVYQAALDDLRIRKLRLTAHWPMIEPARDVYDFSDLDYQISEASKRDAEIILAVGRRLPRWPECHTPGWVGTMPWDEQKMEIRQYLRAVVERYADEPAIVMWQVENEPYLSAFAGHICGELDEEFLIEEIALVRSIDPQTPILVTDSGNIGLWYRPYRLGDAFGTSLYMYFWNQEVGQFKTKWPVAFYRVKANLMRIVGSKPVYLIELSAEPWLVEPVTKVPVETQLTRMDVEKFREIIAYAERTHFEHQYLWGVEWWWYMKENGRPELWDFARTVFRE